MLAALAVRLVYALAVHPLELFPDENRFLCAAENILAGAHIGCGKYAHDMPLVPVLLAACKAVGVGEDGYRALQAVIGALLVLPVAGLAHRLHASRLSLALAGAAVAVYPFFIFYTALLLSETLFVFLTALLFWHFSAPRPGQGWRTGLTAGLAHLTRPTLFYFLPVAAAWQWLAARWSPRRLAVAGVVFALLLAPWVVRNYQVFGQFMATNTGGGQVLWDANNPWNPTGGVPPDDSPHNDMVPDELDELERDKWMKREAVEYMVEDPGRTLGIAVNKFRRFWNLWPNAPQFSQGPYKWAALASFGPVLLLALASLWVLRDRWRTTGLLWLFFAYYTALHLVAMGSIRYRLPLEPLLIALAAACLGRLLRRGKPSREAS